MALEVTVHLDRDLDLAIPAAVDAGTTIAQLKEQLAQDDPTGCLKPEDFVLGCGGRRLADGDRITESLLDLDLWQVSDAPPEPEPAPAACSALALAPAAAPVSSALAIAAPPASDAAPVSSSALAIAAPQAAAPVSSTALALAPAAATTAVATVAIAPAVDAAPKAAAAPAAPAEPMVSSPPAAGDWVRYETAEGKAYFYNTVDGETSWTEPASWRDASKPQAATEISGAKWVRYMDAEGKAYYHDAVSGTTQWEEPFEWTDPQPEDGAAAATRTAEKVAAAAAAARAALAAKYEVNGVKPCAHPLCNFRVHSSPAVSTTHCCRMCKNTPLDQEPCHGGRCEKWSVDCEKCPVQEKPAEQPKAAPSAAPAAPVPRGVADDNSLRKLYESMDRGGRGQVSKRDILVALKKHPPVRRLFGLPVTNVEPGGDKLEARLQAIQESFESGAGLGELSAAFDQLREATEPGSQTFGLNAFMNSCRTGPLRPGAVRAADLLPREHTTGAPFVPTHFFEEVPPGAVCPGGLEYKMDMSTGKTLARWPPGFHPKEKAVSEAD